MSPLLPWNIGMTSKKDLRNTYGYAIPIAKGSPCNSIHDVDNTYLN